MHTLTKVIVTEPAWAESSCDGRLLRGTLARGYTQKLPLPRTKAPVKRVLPRSRRVLGTNFVALVAKRKLIIPGVSFEVMDELVDLIFCQRLLHSAGSPPAPLGGRRRNRAVQQSA